MSYIEDLIAVLNTWSPAARAAAERARRKLGRGPYRELSRTDILTATATRKTEAALARAAEKPLFGDLPGATERRVQSARGSLKKAARREQLMKAIEKRRKKAKMPVPDLELTPDQIKQKKWASKVSKGIRSGMVRG